MHFPGLLIVGINRTPTFTAPNSTYARTVTVLHWQHLHIGHGYSLKLTTSSAPVCFLIYTVNNVEHAWIKVQGFLLPLTTHTVIVFSVVCLNDGKSIKGIISAARHGRQPALTI